MKAIIVVDCQNDFSSTGNLPVAHGESVAIKIKDFIARLPKENYKIIFSRDWHPTNHISFEKWPIHCVKNCHGADYIAPLDEVEKDLEILKGTRAKYDSYSAFYKNKHKSKLDKYLKKNKVNEIFICGLAKDVCVMYTAYDGIKNNYKTYIITDLTLAISEAKYMNELDERIVEINSKKII